MYCIYYIIAILCEPGAFYVSQEWNNEIQSVSVW